MHQPYDGFYFILKKHLKLSQKNNFLAHFERFLLYASLRPASYTRIFCQIKRLMEVHNFGKFYLCSICDCQVINFQIFSQRCSIHEMAPFGGGRGGFWALSQDVNRTYPKLTNLVHFWAQFTPGNPKILPKNKVFSETTSL